MLKAHKTKARETRAKLKRALHAYAATGTMKSASAASGLHRHTIERAIKRYPKYAAAWQEAYETFMDSLEETAIARAQNRSDKLLMFLLRAGRRHKFGSQAVAMHGTTINQNTLNISSEQMVLVASELAKELGDKQRRVIRSIECGETPNTTVSHALDYELDELDEDEAEEAEESALD
jgi:hypothetical protein